MPNQIMTMLMNQLKLRNPQGFQAIQNLMRNNNPEQIMKQFLGNATSEQKQQIFSQAKNIGVPEEVLSKIQNMK